MSRTSALPPPPPGVSHRPGSYQYPRGPPPSSVHYPPDYQFSESQRRNDDMYQFRGNDTYSPKENVRPIRYSPRPSSPRYGGDSYRPGAGGFSFVMEAPPSIDLSRKSDSYRPPPPRYSDHRPDSRDGPISNKRNSRDRGYRGPNRGRDGTRRNQGGYQSRKAAERPFLQTNRAPTPELMPGMDSDDGIGVKFRALEDMSDSDEADMDVSSDEEKEESDPSAADQPKKKQARTEMNASDGDSIPKWSNPDPYTALPPPDESQRKKMDVVKLIRKARVTNTPGSAPKSGAVTDDFISFDFDDDESEDLVNGTVGHGMPGAPTGPRSFSHREELNKLGTSPEERKQFRSSRNDTELDASSDPAFGNRKRTFDDNIKDGYSLPRKQPQVNGAIVKEWKVTAGCDRAPWCTQDHSGTANMGNWLHKEILDFYHHVKPLEFEDLVRSDLIDRLRKVVGRKWKEAEIHPFGSFVAGLYLPTADMDLVMVSKPWLAGGAGLFSSKRMLFFLREYLVNQGITTRDTIEVISGAKVPIIKFIDQATGLRVDVSFENDTGLIANRTFKDWQITYPAMPILVTLIKQFLAMRGLNEPVNGGIGGFSVTCLVISLLQLMPQVQSGNMIPEHHLGEILMEFFDLYGNEFNATTTAIQFDPPGYISKNLLSNRIIYKKPGGVKFSIVDPNNPSNDIAGGSSNTSTILKAFADAFRELGKRMQELSALPIEERRFKSILSVILGGNYASFDLQRERLRKHHQSSVKSSMKS